MEALKDTNQEDTTIADRCLDGAGQAQNNVATIHLNERVRDILNDAQGF